MHCDTYICSHEITGEMLAEISLSLETDILFFFSGIFLQHVFPSHFALQSKGKGSGFFVFVFFSLKSAWPIFVSISVNMISIPLINPLALLMCNCSSLHPVNIGS